MAPEIHRCLSADQLVSFHSNKLTASQNRHFRASIQKYTEVYGVKILTFDPHSPAEPTTVTSIVAMRLVILEDYDKASEWAAKYVRNTILKFNPEPGKFFVLGLPTG